MNKKIPVTVISWFLGAGKTTLLKHILKQRWNIKVAVIVNDMWEINIDTHLIKNEISFSQTEEKLIEMDNGCICCSLRDDLLVEVKRLGEEGRYDAIIIESSGISEPIPVAQTFAYADEESGINLWDFSYIDTMVTVVDAGNFLKHFWNDQTLAELKMWLSDEDHRPLVHLMVEQIEFANVIILNKIDLVTPKEKKYILGIIRGLQLDAKIIETQGSKIEIKEIVQTGYFDFKKVSQSSLWIKELEWGWHNTHTPESLEYGITSFIYNNQKPFHPKRFSQACLKVWPWVIRSKWIVWLASRNNLAGSWSQAWESIKLDGFGRWMGSFTKAERIDQFWDSNDEYEQEFWNQKFWDRHNQLVVIGIDMDISEITQILNQALVTEEEYNNSDSWNDFIDPFPEWIPTT